MSQIIKTIIYCYWENVLYLDILCFKYCIYRIHRMMGRDYSTAMWAAFIHFATQNFINTFCMKIRYRRIKITGTWCKNDDYKYYIFHMAQLIHVMVHWRVKPNLTYCQQIIWIYCCACIHRDFSKTINRHSIDHIHCLSSTLRIQSRPVGFAGWSVI